jgi:hypothetical protein
VDGRIRRKTYVLSAMAQVAGAGMVARAQKVTTDYGRMCRENTSHPISSLNSDDTSTRVDPAY